MEKVESVISSLQCSVSTQSVRDCYRLGKYSTQLPRPRPLLVTLNRVSDVRSVLLKRGSLSKPLVIKPDLSPDQRVCENTLLRERWSLIQSGIDPRSIKISRPKMFVNNVLHGTASGLMYSISEPCSQSPPSQLSSSESLASEDLSSPPISPSGDCSGSASISGAGVGQSND